MFYDFSIALYDDITPHRPQAKYRNIGSNRREN